jgi:hypothetical protein
MRYPLPQSISKLRVTYYDTFPSKMRRFRPIITYFWQRHYTKEQKIENSIAQTKKRVKKIPDKKR